MSISIVRLATIREAFCWTHEEQVKKERPYLRQGKDSKAETHKFHQMWAVCERKSDTAEDLLALSRVGVRPQLTGGHAAFKEGAHNQQQ
ncbi:hypothetical protein QQF64_005357 [Cirrhinus molitorella]|uniref:Uncharacterized protein n=1 Tax=Cirrhinus molitorella TaxID=172907 RepID=A0ABR3MBW7_9TELE